MVGPAPVLYMLCYMLCLNERPIAHCIAIGRLTGASQLADHSLPTPLQKRLQPSDRDKRHAPHLDRGDVSGLDELVKLRPADTGHPAGLGDTHGERAGGRVDAHALSSPSSRCRLPLPVSRRSTSSRNASMRSPPSRRASSSNGG